MWPAGQYSPESAFLLVGARGDLLSAPLTIYLSVAHFYKQKNAIHGRNGSRGNNTCRFDTWGRCDEHHQWGKNRKWAPLATVAICMSDYVFSFTGNRRNYRRLLVLRHIWCGGLVWSDRRKYGWSSDSPLREGKRKTLSLYRFVEWDEIVAWLWIWRGRTVMPPTNRKLGYIRVSETCSDCDSRAARWRHQCL